MAEGFFKFELRISDFGSAKPSKSANAFGSIQRSQLSTFNLQPNAAPLNKERRFIPLRLDDASIKGSLAQFLYINWRAENGKREGEGE